ncbi:MAG: hypothetical protein IKO26_08155 [Paludibacteraceae bacterium]|nr:hypothetical protein [Paludibacteraceae bacterium]
MEQAVGLHQAQMDLLRVVGQMKTVSEVLEIRRIITDYYARKVEEEMEQLWESGTWNQQKIDALANAHLRTPYEYA